MTAEPLNADLRSGASLRARRRRRQTESIERVALKLFAEHGYAAVTIEDIAAAAEISPRTFFRYFPSKDDVLFGDWHRYEDALVTALEHDESGESVIDTLRTSLIELSRGVEADVESTRLRLEVIAQSPDALVAGFEERRVYHRRLLPIVCERMGFDPQHDIRPALVIDLLLSAVYVASWHWLANGASESLPALVTDALSYASAGFEPAHLEHRSELPPTARRAQSR